MRDPSFLSRTRDQIRTDNRAELDAWIDERAAALVAIGMAPDAAHRLAREEFGDVDAAARYADRQDAALDRRIRLLLWAAEFVSDFRLGLRTLHRTPTVTAVVLLTFALGIGATTAVFSVVHATLLRPLPYSDEATLVQLQPVENGVLRPAARYSTTAVAALRERTTSFAGISAVSAGNIVVRDGGDPEQTMIATVTPEAFDVLRVQSALGPTREIQSVSGSADNGVFLLHGLWRRRFGADPGIVGRMVAMGLEGERSEVLGVMPPSFRVPTYEATEILAPQSIDTLLRNPLSARVRVHRLFGRLKPGVSTAAAQNDVDLAMSALQTELPQEFGGIGTRLVPIRAAVAGDAQPRLLVLMGAAAFVLLIACANVASILLARALARRHELSVRVALGAGRRRLIRQFLSEGAVLAALGAGFGLVIAQFGIVALRQLAATVLPPGTMFALDPWVLLFALGSTLAAGVVASLGPALVATRSIGVALRRDDGRVSPSRNSRWLRLGLVAAQLAVSAVLLVGAGLFLRTLHELSALDVGYSTEDALTFRPSFSKRMSNEQQDAFYASMQAELSAIPGVVSVGVGNMPMAAQSTMSGLAIDGRTLSGRLPDVRYTPASDDYFTTLGIPVLRGRSFTAADRSGSPLVAIVSAGLAKQLWPTDDPIGARVKPERAASWFTIVGVVGDVRSGSADPPVASLYTSLRQDYWPGSGTFVVRASSDPAALAAAVRQAVKQVDPTLPIVGLRTLEDLRSSTPAIAERRMQMQLLVVFALIALAVSAIGVYGVSAYTTEARHREFGVRMALGASTRSLLWLALRDGAQIAAIGALVGIPAALWLASRLSHMFFAVTPFDPLTVVVVLATLAIVAFAASLVPARRATLIDPVTTMRAD